MFEQLNDQLLVKSKGRLASHRFSQKTNENERVKKQTKHISPFVFREKLADHKLLSKLTDL